MSVISLDQVSAGLRRRVTRSRRLAKLSHNRAIAELLDDLAAYLDLEAIITESQIDPFARRQLAAGPRRST
jgi:hypothetical protein